MSRAMRLLFPALLLLCPALLPAADISVSGMASRELELESVSGDIVANGAPRRGGISSVSGDIRLALPKSLARWRFRST